MEAQGPTKPTPPPPRQKRHQCPVCHRLFVLSRADLKVFPFCSERCKLVDLGAWLDGDYRIPARSDEAVDEFPTEDTSA